MKTYEFKSIDSFMQTISKGVSVFYCCTSWSSACRSQQQVMTMVALLHEEQATVFQADMARFPELGTYLAIQSVPTTVIFENGVEVKRLIGCQPAEKLHAVIGAVTPSLRFDGRDEAKSLSV